MRGAVQKAEADVAGRQHHLQKVEAVLVARARALERREEAMRRQEAALAALMPRLQAVMRMESAVAALMPRLEVGTLCRSAPTCCNRAAFAFR